MAQLQQLQPINVVAAQQAFDSLLIQLHTKFEQIESLQGQIDMQIKEREVIVSKILRYQNQKWFKRQDRVTFLRKAESDIIKYLLIKIPEVVTLQRDFNRTSEILLLLKQITFERNIFVH